jgi:hypothetical protein
MAAERREEQPFGTEEHRFQAAGRGAHRFPRVEPDLDQLHLRTVDPVIGLLTTQ